ncbi:MAG: ATP-binding protein [Thermogemmata sp.]|nr:ATP-binding protein [Thermogemmata sp.]
MKAPSLQRRFVWAGSVLVATTVGSGLWSWLTFTRLATVVDAAVYQSQEAVDLAAALHNSLEREDDALLLFVDGKVEPARHALAAERQRGDVAWARLNQHLQRETAEVQPLVETLRRSLENYRQAGDRLLMLPEGSVGLSVYHREVNPRLREAVAACDQLREHYFRRMEQVGIFVRDATLRTTRLVTLVIVLTVALGLGVAVWLGRSILRPIRELTECLEEIRKGHFDRRVPVRSGDELGQLAAGFNRMAEALSEYRQSSLGELLVAKMTLEATLHALPNAVLLFTPEGHVAAINPPAQRLLNAQGKPTVTALNELPLPGAYRTAIEAALQGVRAPLPRFDFHQTLEVMVDGQRRRFLMTAVPVPQFAPGRCGAIAVFDDITEFVRLDQLRGELIGMASHELKSPLTILQMNLLMLQEGAPQLSERQRQLLTAAIDGCVELGRTVEEWLDLTRIEAGQLRLNLAPLDLKALLASVIRALQPRFDDASITLVMEDNQQHPLPAVWGDAARLSNVVANVLTNALKYTPSGGVVRIQLISRQNAGSDPTATVQIAVTDQGPGVPAEFRERIFEKFFRLEHHLGPRGKDVRGTGIGLYLCRQIIAAHGGTITCEPGENARGTRFVISLPVRG